MFAAVRGACDSTQWSRGVELARGDSVVLESADAAEPVLRVLQRGNVISPQVRFNLEDKSWKCECPQKQRGCEHAAASVIALRLAQRQGKQLSVAETRSFKVRHRLERRGAGLSFSRELVRGDETRPFGGSLASLSRAGGPTVVATQADLAVELAMGGVRHGPLAAPQIPKLFRALARCDEVLLDGEPIEISPEPVLPRVEVRERGSGFELRLVEEKGIEERFDARVVRIGDALRPLGDSLLDGRERHELPRGRAYGPEQMAQLVTEDLPRLRKRLPVDVLTDKLPGTSDDKPRIELSVERDGFTLAVLPRLVYGHPARARVDAGRLVHLEGPVPVRDLEAEKRLLRRMRQELDLAPGVRERFVAEDAVGFVAKLRGWKDSIEGDAHEGFYLAPPIEPELDLDGTRLDVMFRSRGAGGKGGGRADAAEVIRAWSAGSSLVPLTGGGWAPLPMDWLGRYGRRVADLLAARDERGEVPKASLPDLARLCADLDQPAPPEVGQMRALLDGFEGIPAAELPGDLEAELRPYQRQGIDWLSFHREAGLGALLADDMGLGKTLQALCALRGRTLVVAPTSVLQNWLDEAAKFRPSLRGCRYHGPKRALDPDADLTVTTYALLRLDADKLAAERWDTVVLDEAQAIKNPDSQVARAAYRLDAGFRLALTGTPVENRLDELWSQFHFINRGLLGGRTDFDERYSRPIDDGDPLVTAHLRERIGPFVLRRLKSEVATDLPPRTEVVLHCELSGEERDTYEAVRAATRRDVVAKLQGGGNVLAALEALLRLRQAACHRGLIPGQTAERSSKVSLLRENLETIVAEGHKALVFSQWTSLLDRIEPELQGGIPYCRLDGSTSDRGAVVKRFQADAGPPVMLISLRAGGTGLTLTAADHVFIVDPWWNPAVEDQAADRAHRIGQDKPVMVYRLVAEDTVEERILELQQRKRAVADAALGGKATASASLSRDDLLALLEG
ncbi:helicase [Acidobacteria bacterium Mor1]|nr:helicase [Acidobacteria bacterium Mor1]